MDVNKMYDTRTNRELVTGYAGIKGYEIGVNYTVARNVMAAFNYFDYQGADNNIIKDRMMWTQLYYIFDLKYDRKRLFAIIAKSLFYKNNKVVFGYLWILLFKVNVFLLQTLLHTVR